MTTGSRPRRIPRLLAPALRALDECSLALGSRWELARLEWDVERQRLLQAVAGLAVLALGGLLALAAAGLALVVTWWDTEHRVLVAWLVVGAYATIALVGLFVWRFADMRKERRFAALRAELATDREWLGRRFHREIGPHD